jgi:hypothetical protein
VTREAIVDLAAAAMAGARRARRYPGLLLATFAVQLALSLVPAALAFALLVIHLGDEPALGRAVDGDLAAAFAVLEAAPTLPVAAAIAIALVALIWVAASWFLTAGLIGSYTDEPEGAAATARCFGAHGARRFFGFARLFLLMLPLYAAIAAWAGFGLASVAERSLEMIDAGEVIAALIGALGGPALLVWLLWTAADYARIELVADPRLASSRALWRGAVTVLRRPRCTLHAAAGHLAVAALAAIYVAVAGLGLSVVALVVVRQLFSLGRHGIHLAVIGGQIELAARLRRR